MAGYDAYDPRLESLVVETLTHWSPEVQSLSEDDRKALSKAIHARPDLASHITYERTHTGFIREITVTPADIERLYEQNVAAAASG